MDPPQYELKNQDPIFQDIFQSFMEYVEKNIASCNIYSNDGYKIKLNKVRLWVLLLLFCQIIIVLQLFSGNSNSNINYEEFNHFFIILERPY